MRSALIVQGGWGGHQPREVAETFSGALRQNDFDVEVSNTLDSFRDEARLKSLDLIVPIWTMGKIEKEQLAPLLAAVKSGVGIAGVHGGMGDAFREQTEYQFMVGGQWVAHPGGADVTYSVHIEDTSHPITQGIGDFSVTSEQYYMHVDPGNQVLATTSFGDVVMPVTWLRAYGKGRVFYCSLGHSAEVARMPQVLSMVSRGMIWAAEGKPIP